MVFAGQLRRELAAAEAGRGPGRSGPAPWASGAHGASGDAVGSCGPGSVAPAPESGGADRLPPADGPGSEPTGVFALAPLPAARFVDPGRRDAPVHPGPVRPLDGRSVFRRRAPEGGCLRPCAAAAAGPSRSAAGPSGIREELHPDRHPAGGGAVDPPFRLCGFGESADGAPFGPAGGAGGGRGPSSRAAVGRDGPGRGGGGPGRGEGGAGAGERAGVCGDVAPAAG